MATKRRKPTAVALEEAVCSVHVQRSGVEVSLDGVRVRDVVAIACYLLDRFNERQFAHPEIEPPNREVVQIGDYTPVAVTDDETLARKRPRRVGF